ncbi:MAG: hypothetical protein ABII00_14825 [Elusimicrobiota bacterium]
MIRTVLQTLREGLAGKTALTHVRPRRPGALLRGAFFALAALLWLAPSAVRADDPSDNSDSITIIITPTVDLGVEIDTSAVNLNFTMAMGATDFTVVPATLTILGNVNPIELDVQGTNVSGSPVWTLDADETPGQDELQVYGLFSVGRSTRPLESEFAGAKNLVTPAAKRAGQEGGSGPDQNFENNQMLGGADMDGLNVGDQRQLWLRIDAPPVTSTTEAQQMRVTVTATRSNM